jgi:hypothetical protein
MVKSLDNDSSKMVKSLDNDYHEILLPPVDRETETEIIDNKIITIAITSLYEKPGGLFAITLY